MTTFNIAESIEIASENQYREKEGSAERFVELVDSLDFQLDEDICRSLLRTFRDEVDDHGTQESVCRILSGVSDEIIIDSIICELDILLKNSPEWLGIILLAEIRNRPNFWKICGSKPECEILKNIESNSS